MVRFDLTDDNLFGNEAAEDEQIDIFRSHLHRRDDLAAFENPTAGIRIAMAYKGQGKSSLLRALGETMGRRDEALVIKTTGGAIFLEVTGYDTGKWARAWKKELYKLIAVTFGAEIGLAWNDDTISLVEEAEKEGSRRRSILSAIYDRLTPSLKVAGPLGDGSSAELTAARARPPITSHERVLARHLDGSLSEIWLIVDDVDRNFRATKSDKARIVGFFDAIRDMRNSIPQLRVRTSIRPNVYASVRLDFESISHIGQYVTRLSWDEDQLRSLLARRVEGYLNRSFQSKGLNLPVAGPQRDLFYISLLFESPVRWGEASKPIHVPLYTLSAGRPRWLIELCKRSASLAFSRHSKNISIEDVRRVMEEFGEARRADIVAEFGAKCVQLSDLIDAFYAKKETYTTEELYALINGEILTKFSPSIAGLSGQARAPDVATLLFEVGLFHGRRDLLGGKYEHIPFSKRPTAFTSMMGVEPGIRWEIHPVFRAALGLRPEIR